MRDAVEACRDCKGFVLDMRGNPGGIGGIATGVAGCGGDGTHWRFTKDDGVRLRDAVSVEALSQPDGSILLYVNTPRAIDG